MPEATTPLDELPQFDQPLGMGHQPYAMERLWFHAHFDFGEATLANMEISRMDDVVCRNLIYELRTAVYGHRLDSHVIETPKDWWEHFKLRWFPKRFLRRFPIRYQEHRMQLWALHPKLRHLPPGLDDFVYHIQVEEA